MTPEELHQKIARRELGLQAYLILRNLTESPEMPSYFAKLLGCSLINAYGHINRLEDRGMVEKKRKKGNRNIEIHLTEQGQQLVREIEG